MDLYLVAVVLNPTKKQREEEEAYPMLVVEPTAVIAKDEQHATMKAIRLVPEEHSQKDDRLEVRVIPFRRTCA